jgi:hypothetical protein
MPTYGIQRNPMTGPAVGRGQHHVHQYSNPPRARLDYEKTGDGWYVKADPHVPGLPSGPFASEDDARAVGLARLEGIGGSVDDILARAHGKRVLDVSESFYGEPIVPEQVGESGEVYPMYLPCIRRSCDGSADLVSDVSLGEQDSYECPMCGEEFSAAEYARKYKRRSNPHRRPNISAAKRHKLPNRDFAVPENEGLPMDTANRTRAALARFNQYRFDSGAQASRAYRRLLRRAKTLGIDASGFAAEYKPPFRLKRDGTIRQR